MYRLIKKSNKIYPITLSVKVIQVQINDGCLTVFCHYHVKLLKIFIQCINNSHYCSKNNHRFALNILITL